MPKLPFISSSEHFVKGAQTKAQIRSSSGNWWKLRCRRCFDVSYGAIWMKMGDHAPLEATSLFAAQVRG